MLRNAFAITFLGVTMALSLSSTASARAISRSTGELNPQINRTSVKAFADDSYYITFKGGELARVEVNGDGSTYLDLSVYDESGNLVRSQPGFRPWIEFHPNYTGSYHVVIHNRGTVENDYVLRTN